MKKSAIIIAALLILFSFINTCYSVTMVDTASHTDGDKNSIYIASEIDLYPVEYYEDKVYKGVMTYIFEYIHKSTGISFAYIHSANKLDTNLVENNQVDIVTGMINKTEFENHNENILDVFDYTKDGDIYTVYIKFTAVCDETRRESIKKAVEQIPESEILGLTMSHSASQRADMKRYVLNRYVIILSSILTALIVFLIIKLSDYKKKLIISYTIDKQLGIGNKQYYKYVYDRLCVNNIRELYFVMYFSVDYEKYMKYHGIDGCEELIKSSVDVIKSFINDEDYIFKVADYGVLLLHQCISKKSAKELSRKIVNELNVQFNGDVNDILYTFRCGIYEIGGHDRSADIVMYNAIQGYEEAKLNNKLYEVYTPKMQISGMERVELCNEINKAIRQKQFKLYMQFIVSSDDGKIVGAESLSRWEHPQKGILSPAKYIDMLNQVGKITDHDVYFFEMACIQLESWHNEGYDDIFLSCNFSRLVVSEEEIVDNLIEISNRYSFNKNNMILEITEDAIEKHTDISLSNVSRLKDNGFNIAIDDMGTGCSSLNDIKKYPVDIIKVDRILCIDLDNKRNRAILEGFIDFCHNLNIKVICEGIEDKEQAEILRDIKTDYLQGYYFSYVFPQREAYIEKVQDDIDKKY